MSDTAAPAPSVTAAQARRKRQLIGLAVVVGAGIIAWGAWALLFGGRKVETDNAYVGADTALVTPLVPGPAAQVLVGETEVVKKGQVLVVLDDADARIAVAQARAALGQAQRRVRGYEATDTALAGQLAAREADAQRTDAQVLAARSDVERARTDLSRREALAGSGAVSGEELTTAKNQLANAQAALASALAARAEAAANSRAAAGSREANRVLIAGSSLDANPEVAAARARLDAAQLALSRTVIRAPTDGVVTKKAVQVGQQVQAGSSLMTIAPTTRAFVDANFKEVQLKKVRVGQPVTLTSDLYGGGVKFHGRVTGVSGGTGAAFSLIPAQNASGNWIKVVQRVPVRIQLDPKELADHPLRVGLSMKVAIDVSGA